LFSGTVQRKQRIDICMHTHTHTNKFICKQIHIQTHSEAVLRKQWSKTVNPFTPVQERKDKEEEEETETVQGDKEGTSTHTHRTYKHTSYTHAYIHKTTCT